MWKHQKNDGVIENVLENYNIQADADSNSKEKEDDKLLAEVLVKEH